MRRRVSLGIRLGCTLIALFACVRAGWSTTPSERATDLGAKVDSVVRSALVSRNIPGAAIGVLRADTLVFAKGYGFADLATRREVTSSTIFQIASTTKPFTAMAVMMLVEEDRVDLDAPAKRYLPWLPDAVAGITVRQLLTHTSGIYPDVRLQNVDEFSIDEFIRRIAVRQPQFDPGTRWEYSNAGYTVLSLIAEAVTGEKFGAFVTRRIFRPLGMEHTAYRVAETPDTQHAIGYDMVDGQLVRAPHVFSGWGNSGMESTVLDLAKWVIAVQQRQLLTPESYRLIFGEARTAADTAVHFEFRGARSSYGLGWFLTSYKGVPLRTHGGAIAGFNSIISWFPDQRTTIIVLSNGKQGTDRVGQADALSRAVSDVIPIP